MNKARKKKMKAGRFLVYLVLFVGGFLSLVPFFWLIRSAFMNMLEIYTLPPIWWSEHPTWENFKTVFLQMFRFFRIF